MKALTLAAIPTARASLLVVALVGAPSLALAQPLGKQAPVAPAAPAPVAAPAAPAAPAAVAPAAPAAPNAVPPAQTTVPVAIAPFPLDDNAAQPAAPAPPMIGRRFLVPRVVVAQSQEPPPPPTPPKTHYPIGLEFDVMPVWQTSRGYDLFSDNDIATRVGLVADLELVEVAEKTPLAIELGWTTESQSQSALGGKFEAELSAHNLHGGLKLRHQLLSFLAPHLHVAAGASSLRAQYTVLSASATSEFRNHEWVAFGMLGAGVTASIPTQVAVQPGLVVEGGYLVSGAMALRLDRLPDDLALATSGATLGSLGRSGAYLRFGAFIRY